MGDSSTIYRNNMQCINYVLEQRYQNNIKLKLLVVFFVIVAIVHVPCFDVTGVY